MSAESDNIIQVITDLIFEGRYLAAENALIQYQNGVENGTQVAITDEKHIKIVEDLRKRVSEVKNALSTEDINDEWIFGISYFGITTHYKLSSDSSDIIVRMEGVLELPLFEQCATVHEVDLFREWLPFCSDSKTIEKLQPAELIAYLCWSVPPISRDCLLRAYGADCLHEEGKVVLIGSSIDNWDSEIPFKQEGWFHKRMIIKKFEAIVHVLSPNSGKVLFIIRLHFNNPF